VIHSPRNIVTLFLLAAVALTLGLGAGVAPASAKGKPPCWKTLINDWYDGRIDGVYAIHCYREALQHLPTDVDTYSSAREDIKQALQKRITQGAGGGTTTTGGDTSSGGGTAPGSGGGGSNNGGSNNGGGTQGGGGKSTSGPVQDVFDATKPGNADSVPVPLIVLGAVALLLIVAGATGFLTRRMRTRRVQLASAAATQPGPGKPPRPQ
jgi:hypothetical protein